MLRSLLVAALLLAGIPAALFAQAKTDKKTLLKDSAAITPREPAAEEQQDYFTDKDWRYDRDDEAATGPDEPTFFDRLWNDFWDGVSESFRGSDGSGMPNGWTILLFLVLAALIVLAVLKITNSGTNKLFAGKAREKEDVDATLEDVNIHEIDFGYQIGEALARRDYRLAVRLWFLRTLKTLSDKELIRWQIDKTNSDYYYELSGSTYQREFGEVSNVYDHIWYGEFPVNETSYQSAEEKFKSLSGKIAG